MAKGPGGAGNRRLALLLAAACGLGAFLLVVALGYRPYEPPGGTGTLDDVNNMRGMAGLLVREGSPLAADGRLDAYGVLVRDDWKPEELVRLCFSKRSGKGPSSAEIAARDYSSFPWQRHKGAFDPGADPPVPILWEREPRKGHDGSSRLVAYSDSSVLCLFDDEDAAMREFFRRNPGQE